MCMCLLLCWFKFYSLPFSLFVCRCCHCFLNYSSFIRVLVPVHTSVPSSLCLVGPTRKLISSITCLLFSFCICVVVLLIPAFICYHSCTCTWVLIHNDWVIHFAKHFWFSFLTFFVFDLILFNELSCYHALFFAISTLCVLTSIWCHY